MMFPRDYWITFAVSMNLPTPKFFRAICECSKAHTKQERFSLCPANSAICPANPANTVFALMWSYVVLPLSGNRSFIVRSKALLTEVLDEQSYITVDQVARFIVSEDSAIQIIDLRSPEEFKTPKITSNPAAKNLSKHSPNS